MIAGPLQRRPITVAVVANAFERLESRTIFELSPAEGPCTLAAALGAAVERGALDARALADPALIVHVNGAQVPAPEWGERSIDRGAHVSIVRFPGDPTTVFGVQLLLAVGLTVAARLLFKPPSDLRDRDDEASTVYSFGGITNNRVAGQPIPLVYGEMRVGGTVIAQSILTDGWPPRTTLWVLLSLGHGPFHSIAGETEDTPDLEALGEARLLPDAIEINGNPATNFDGVRAWVRLGRNEQRPIPGFATLQLLFGVDLPLETETTSSEINLDRLVLGFSVAGDDEFDATNDAFWTASAAGFDLDDQEYDAAILRIQFPAGLYRQDPGSGALLPVPFRFQVRYRELDPSGNPIATGGYANDGWVRLPTFGPFEIQQRGSFELATPIDFVDPQSHTPGIPGGASSVNGTAGSRISTPAGPGMGFAPGNQVDVLSAAVWVNFQALPSNPAVGDIVPIFGDYEVATDRGWALYLQRVEYPNQGSPTRRWVLTARVGRGNGLGPIVLQPATANAGQSPPGAGTFDTEVGRWHHVGYSFRDTTRLRLFFDGATIADLALGVNDELEWQGGSVDLASFPRWLPTRVANALFDQVVVWHRELAGTAMNAVWNFGSGNLSTLGTQVVLRHEFEAPTPALQTAGVPWYGDATAVGAGATLGGSVGVVFNGTLGQRRRSRWRVEVLRINPTSTNARVAHESRWLDIQGVVDAALSYPGEALLAVAIPASDQLSSSTPTITTLVRGRRVPLWDGASTSLPNLRRLWSANPAWIALDLLTDAEVGMGRRYRARDVDLERLLEWAGRCDEVLYDGRRVIEFDHTNAGDDVRYVAGVADATGRVRGQLEVLLDVGAHPSLPVTWEPGRFLRLGSFPAAGLATDINTVAGEADPAAAYVGGYEIAEILLVAGQHVVRVWWDRTGEPDPWPSGTLASATLTSAALLDGALVAGGHPRFEFNGVFDTLRGAWDALLEVAGVGRAAVIQEGRRLRFKHAGPRPVVGLVTAGMITEGTFEIEYASARSRENALELSILDREAGYSPTPVEVPGESILDLASQDDIRLGRRELFGVTDQAQARREGAFQLRVNRFLLRSGAFTAGPEGLPFEVGDVLRVAHDLAPSRGIGGRTPGASAPSEPTLVVAGDDLADASWTATGVAVALDGTEPVTGEAAYRLTDSTSGALGKVTTDAAVDQAGGLEDGAWCLSFLVAPGTSTRVAAEIASTRGPTLMVAFDLAAPAVAWQAGLLKGGSGIVPVSGGWVFAWVWVSWVAVATTERLRFALAPAAGADAAAAGAATGTARFARVAATRGRFPAFPDPLRMVLLAADLDLAPATTYVVHVAGEGVSIATAEIDPTLTPTGLRRRGEPVWLAAPLAFAPTHGAQQIVVAEGTELLIELTAQRRRADLATEFRWIEYRDDVYSDETPPPTDLSRLPSIGTGAGSELGDAAPLPATIVDVRDYLERTGAGRFRSRLGVTWRHDPASIARVAGTELLLRPGVGGAFRVVALASGIAPTSDVFLDDLPAGTVIELAVRPFSAGGARAVLAGGSRYIHTVRGLGQVPPALASAAAQLVGAEALYSWVFPVTDDARTLRVECRRGGAWGLGDRVFVSEPGSTSFGPTTNWAGDDEDEITGLHFRTIDAAGQYGPVLSIDFDPELAQASTQPALPYRAGAWETFILGGWVAAIPATDGPLLTGALVEHASGYLEFTGSGLTGAYVGPYESALSLGDASGREPHLVRVEALLDAEVVPPIAEGDAGHPWGTAELSRFDAEGPSFVLPGEEAAPTVRIQAQFKLGGADDSPWTAWKDFAPGFYRVVDVRFRLQATRASSAWNVRIHRFHTRVYAPRPSVEQATPVRRHLDAAFFG